MSPTTTAVVAGDGPITLDAVVLRHPVTLQIAFGQEDMLMAFSHVLFAVVDGGVTAALQQGWFIDGRADDPKYHRQEE